MGPPIKWNLITGSTQVGSRVCLVELKLKLSSSLRCGQIHINHCNELGQTFVVLPNSHLGVQQTHHSLGYKYWAVGEVTDSEKHFSSLQYGIIYTDLQMYKRVCAPFNKTSAKLARVINTKKHLSSFIWARHLNTFFTYILNV